MKPELIKRRDEMAYFHMHATSRYQRSEKSFQEGFDACYNEIYKQGENEILILGLSSKEIEAFKDYLLNHNGVIPEIFGRPLGREE